MSKQPVCRLNLQFRDFNFIVLGVILGFGITKVGTALALIWGLYFVTKRISYIKISLGELITFILIISYLAVYAINYAPVIQPPGSTAKQFGLGYLVFISSVALSGFLIFVTEDFGQKIKFLIAISLGLLLRSSVVVVGSLIHLKPPFYGKAYDPLNGAFVNTPSFSNMASFIAWTLIALFFFRGFQTGLKLKVLGIAVMGIAFSIGTVFVGRSFFVICFLALSMAFIPYMRQIRVKVLAKSIIIGILALSLFDVLAKYYFYGYRLGRELLISRIMSQGLESTRFKFYSSWLQQFYEDPLSRPQVDRSIEPTYWFHNFWMDTQRTSGLIALILSTLIFLLPMASLILKSVQGNKIAWRLFTMLTCMTIIMASSVAMEAGDSGVIVFMAVLALTAFSASDYIHQDTREKNSIIN